MDWSTNPQIDKIQLPNSETVYDIADTLARNAINNYLVSISGVMHFIGTFELDTSLNTVYPITSDSIVDGFIILKKDVAVYLSTNAYDQKIILSGDVMIVDTGLSDKLFVLVVDATGNVIFSLLGSTGSLKAFAFKDSVDFKITPSLEYKTLLTTIDTSAINLTTTITPQIKLISKYIKFTGDTISDVSYTPTGSIYTYSKIDDVDTYKAYTPSGNVTGTSNTTLKDGELLVDSILLTYVLDRGTFDAGLMTSIDTPAKATFEINDDGVLKIGWTDMVYSNGKAPSLGDASTVTKTISVSNNLLDLKFEGYDSNLVFVGSQGNVSLFTPSGILSDADALTDNAYLFNVTPLGEESTGTVTGTITVTLKDLDILKSVAGKLQTITIDALKGSGE